MGIYHHVSPRQAQLLPASPLKPTVKMGSNCTKPQKKSLKDSTHGMNIPVDSPLGLMLKEWDLNENTKGKNKLQMVQYCVLDWPQQPIRSYNVHWPRYGSTEEWLCKAVNAYINRKDPPDPTEQEYAACWWGQCKVKAIKVKQRQTAQEEGLTDDKRWDPLSTIPSAYAPPAPTAAEPAEMRNVYPTRLRASQELQEGDL